MLSIKELKLIFIGRSRNYLYKFIRIVKYKYGLTYDRAELPIDVVIKETGMSRETIYDLLSIKNSRHSNVD